jgi:hypothetical protein
VLPVRDGVHGTIALALLYNGGGGPGQQAHRAVAAIDSLIAVSSSRSLAIARSFSSRRRSAGVSFGAASRGFSTAATAVCPSGAKAAAAGFFLRGRCTLLLHPSTRHGVSIDVRSLGGALDGTCSLMRGSFATDRHADSSRHGVVTVVWSLDRCANNWRDDKPTTCSQNTGAATVRTCLRGSALFLAKPALAGRRNVDTAAATFRVGAATAAAAVAGLLLATFDHSSGLRHGAEMDFCRSALLL